MFRRLTHIKVFAILFLIGNSIPAYAEPSKIFLRLEVTSSKQVEKIWTLKCAPNGGNHPIKGQACNFLLSNAGKKAIFPQRAENCTQIFGGSATATITGRYQDSRIKLDLDRRDGCGINSWDQLIKILRVK
jgi:hypothetical protein